MSEFHNLSELALNDQGQSWANLGYWKEHNSYSGACQALARLLAEKTALNSGSRVMDVGYGCGDQLLVWLNEYDVEHIQGINNSKSQTTHAKTKLINNGYSNDTKYLIEGNGCDFELWHHLRLKAASPQTLKPLNRVLALDCIYHFTQKQDFLSLCFQYLERNGILGVTDFILNSDRLTISKQLKLKTMLHLSRIPTDNIVTSECYVRQLKRTGFKNIELTDISQHIMPKFKQWLTSTKTSKRYEKLPWQLRLKYQTTAEFLNWAYKNNVLRYIVVTATKEK